MKGKGKWMVLAVLLLAAVAAARWLGRPADPVPTPPPTETADPWSNEKAGLDMSRLEEGLVSARYTGGGEARIKFQVRGEDGVEYNYDLNGEGEWETFSFTRGEGTYTLRVLENTRENRYIPVLTREVEVALADPLAPFLHPNQFVNYTPQSQAALLAEELAGQTEGDSGKIGVLFDYVTDHISYDMEKAEQVESGYLPDVDAVLAAGKGICFDYAALLAAMLRSQGVPCRLMVGYSGEVYHAWVEVWCEEGGSIGGEIPLAAGEWTLLDPTFVSSNARSEEILAYVTTRENYQAEYVY